MLLTSQILLFVAPCPRWLQDPPEVGALTMTGPLETYVTRTSTTSHIHIKVDSSSARLYEDRGYLQQRQPNVSLENPPRVNPLPKQNNKRSVKKKNNPNVSSELALVPVHCLHAHTRGVWKCSCRRPLFELLLRLFSQMHATRGL